MNRDSISWTGVLPAVTTPFAGNGEVDHEALTANIRRLMTAGCTGAIGAGCTGEFWSLKPGERAEIYRTVVRSTGPEGVAIVGCSAITAGDVLEAMHAAKDAGADAGLVVPPYFAHLTDSQIIRHYETIAAKAPLPIVLYNIPGNAGNALTPDIVDVLADLDPVVAIKESSGDWLNFQKTLRRAGERIRVFCGPSSTLGVPAIQAGADGLMDCFPNVWRGCIDLWDLVRSGEMEKAWAYQSIAQAMTDLFVSEGRTLYPSTKAVMDHLGLPGGGSPRPPLQELTGTQREDLVRKFDAMIPKKSKTAA